MGVLGGGAASYERVDAHKKQRPPRTLQKDFVQGPMGVLGGGAASYQRVTAYNKQRPPRTLQKDLV